MIRSRVKLGLRLARKAMLCALIGCAMSAAQADTAASEYAVKAAIVYKIAKFVSWPESDPRSTGGALSICLSPNDPINDSIRALSGERIHGRKILILTLEDISTAASDCSIVYMSRPTIESHSSVLAQLSDSPVLTIGDGGTFTEAGGIVGLEVRQNRVRFAINVEASQRAGLDISSQLLQLANIGD